MAWPHATADAGEHLTVPGSAPPRPAGSGDAAGITGQGEKVRQPWIDIARGMTIVMVVLLHTGYLLDFEGDPSGAAALVNAVLTPLRMPLFFLLSGMLGADALARPARSLLTGRIGQFLWIWAVWSALGSLVAAPLFQALGLRLGGTYEPALNPLFLLRTAYGWAWYLYALALFYLLALVLRRLSPPLHAMVALLLGTSAALGLGESVGLGVLDRFYFYPYFVIGLFGSDLLWRIVPRAGCWTVVLTLAGAYLAGLFIAHALHSLYTIPARLLLSGIAVPTALSASALLAASELCAPLRVLGTRTLGVYLLHPYLLRLLVAIPRPDALAPLAWCASLAGAAILCSVLLAPLLARVPGLLSLPWERRPSTAPLAAGQDGHSARVTPASRSQI